MMRRQTACLALIIGLCTSTSALARDYYYFNKPGVSRDDYVAAKLECDRLAGGVSPKDVGPVYVVSNPNLTAGQNAAAVAIGSLFAGLLLGGENRKVMRAVERTCMADKGYGRYKVEKAFVTDIAKLKSDNDRVDRYFALATMDSPVGERMKE
jgi:hypothetical protein